MIISPCELNLITITKMPTETRVTIITLVINKEALAVIRAISTHEINLLGTIKTTIYEREQNRKIKPLRM